MELFGFVFGIYAKYFFCPWIFIPFILFFSKNKIWRISLFFISGYLLISIHTKWNENEYVSQYLTGKHRFTGKIINFPQQYYQNKRYLVQIKKIDKKPVNIKVWLYLNPKTIILWPGEIWQWEGRLRLKTDFYNPGKNNFWYRKDFRHILADVYLFAHLKKIEEVSSNDLFNKYRIFIYKQAFNYFQDKFARSTFLALILGLGSELDALSWSAFKATGTVHLMVVSGAHLSLLMWIIFQIVTFVGNLYPQLYLKYPAKRIASLFSLLFGFAYVLISGASVPVLRAWLMMLFSVYQYFGERYISSWQGLRWSFFIILVYEPHALFYPGTYLSFFAVAILIFFANLKFKYKAMKMVVLQFACIFGLAPFTILWFKSIPTTGLFTNIIAIPWVSYLMLPLAFISAVCPNTFSFDVYQQLTQFFHQMLIYFQNFQYLNVSFSWKNDGYAWLIILFGVTICWFPLRIFFLCFILMLMMILIPHQARRQHGVFWVDVMDVGQGLAVFLRTANHELLYDTAGRYGKNIIANQTIIPYLQYEGIQQLDKIIVSHYDMDHRGGLSILKPLFLKAQVVADSPELYANAYACHHQKKWCWDGVCFQFLNYEVKRASRNNHSCVLRVYNQSYQVLLTGDIEKKAEIEILKQYQKILPSTILIVPHHGSKTSSIPLFIRSISPKLGIISYAQYNPYHLPHPDIIKRYQAFHIPLFTTAESGMVRIILGLHDWHSILWRYKTWFQYWIY